MYQVYFKGLDKQCYVGAHLEWCIPDVVVLVVATDFIGLCGFLLFFGCWLQSKRGWAYSRLIGCSTNSIILRMLVRKEEVCHIRRRWNFRMVWNYHFFRESRECISVDWSWWRNHVSSNNGVSLFLTYVVGGIFESVVSFISGKSWIIDIDKESDRSMHLRGSTKCYWLMWDNDWLGAWVPRVCSWSGRTIGEIWGMNSLMKHYWWLRLGWFCGYLLFVTVAIVYWFQTREGSKMMTCYYTSNIFRTWWMIEGHF